MQRVNQRTVNKKSIESLAYSGAFDCFKELHRAQYFYIPAGDTQNGIERLIRFGNVYQTNKTQSTNNLFGDTVMPEIAAPRLPSCEPWVLMELLEHERDVIGVFMSGNPLDHFKFEMKYYSITNLAEFNEINESNTLISANLSKTFRLAGWVKDAQHKITKTGKNFGKLTIEDFSGKTELLLWSDEYMRFKDYIDKGKNILVTGHFKTRYNSEEYEFKATSITLLETAKQNLTKQLELNIHPSAVSRAFIDFVDNNVRTNPGRSSLKFNIHEPIEQLKVSLYNTEKGFSMNEEMAAFLLNNPEVEVNVALVGN